MRKQLKSREGKIPFEINVDLFYSKEHRAYLNEAIEGRKKCLTPNLSIGFILPLYGQKLRSVRPVPPQKARAARIYTRNPGPLNTGLPKPYIVINGNMY